MLVKKTISKRRVLVGWVAYLIAGILLFGSFLLGAGNARPATLEGSNIITLLLTVLSLAMAMIYFRIWLRLDPVKSDQSGKA